MIFKASSLKKISVDLLPFSDAVSDELPLGQLLRLSLFQVSVGMAAVMLLGTLNRVMIVELNIGAMLVGCLAMTYGISLPAKELVISASILILGILVFRGKTLSSYTSLTLFGVFGLFHGSAFGETIFAQESTMDMDILMGYLFGLAAIQYTVAIGVGLVINRYMKVLEAIDLRVRLLGAMVAGAGSLLVLEHIEGLAFTALNIS